MDAEVIVVGGGIVGLWTAYHLVKQGIKTILFEQFPYPHTRGSSHGQSRITRYAYQQEEYIVMMPECFRKWRQLESESGKELLLKTGLINVFDMTKSDHSSAFHEMLDQMDRHAPDVEVIPGEDLERRFPGFRFSSKYKGLYDDQAGLLKADKCLLTLQELVLKQGGRIFDGEVVLSLNPISESKVEVKTSKKSYMSRSVVLACGPYTNKLLSTTGIQLPLAPRKPVVFYWRDQSPSQKYSLSNKFPATYHHNSFYSIPAYEYPGMMKICYDAIVSLNIESPNVIEPADQEREKRRMIEFKKQIRDHFPEIDINGPAVCENCIYTRTPHNGFIIDHHPKFKNVVIGAGFSGHGFKTAPSVGHMLSNMAIGLQPPYPSEPFKIKRSSTQSRL